jgi:hypothetical protein
MASRAVPEIAPAFGRVTIETLGYDIADLAEAVAGGMQMSLLR